MTGRYTRVGAGVTLVALGGLAGYALNGSDETGARNVAAARQPVEVRTQTIHRTVRVVKHEKPRHPRRHGPTRGSSGPGTPAAPTRVASAAPPPGPTATPSAVPPPSAVASAPRSSAPVRTRSSGSSGSSTTHSAPTHHPVTTRTSGGGSGGGGGGEHEHEHEGGDD